MASRWARGAAVFLAATYAAVLLAGFLGPYLPAEQDRDYPYAPPMRIHFFDQQGRFHWRPFVYGWKAGEGIHEYSPESGSVLPVRFFVRGATYKFMYMFPSDRHLFGVDPPTRICLLGTDGLGRDQLSRLLYGGGISLAAGLLATAITLMLGLAAGVSAGYFGRWADTVLMRAAELFLALPWLYLLLAVRAFLPLRIGPVEAFLLIVIVVGIAGWARPARLIRGVVLGARDREFVVAARSAGATHAYILRAHVLGLTSGVLFTQAALLLPQYILAEVTLSFVGLGVAEPVPSWGNMLQALQQYQVLVSYWWMLIPGLVMIPVFWAFSVLAEYAHARVEFRA